VAIAIAPVEFDDFPQEETSIEFRDFSASHDYQRVWPLQLGGK